MESRATASPRIRRRRWVSILGIVLALVAFPVTASIVLSLVQVLQPFTLLDPCEHRASALFAPAEPAVRRCDAFDLQGAPTDQAPRFLRIQSSADEDQLEISWTIKLADSNPLIARVRGGDAALNAYGFTLSVFGDVLGSELDVPIIESTQGGSVSSVIVNGSLPYPSSWPSTIVARLAHPATIEVDLNESQQIIATQPDNVTTIEQDANQITASADSSFNLVIAQAGASPSQVAVPATPSGLQTTTDIVVDAWSLFRAFLLASSGAVPWLALALAVRGRTGVFRRLRRAIYIVLLFHLVVSLGALLLALAEIPNKVLYVDSFRRALNWVAPWFSVGSVRISGALILLFAAAVVLMPRAAGSRNNRAQRYGPLWSGKLLPTHGEWRLANSSRVEQRRRNLWLIMISLTLIWGLAILWYVQKFIWYRHSKFADLDAFDVGVRPVSTVVLATGILLLLAVGANRALQIEDRRALPLVAVSAVPLAMLATIVSLDGALPTFFRFVAVYAAGAGVLWGLAIIILGPRTVFSRWWMVSIGLAGVALATPNTVSGSAGDVTSGWFLALTFGLKIDGLTLVVCVLPVLVSVLIATGGQLKMSYRRISAMQQLGWGCVFVAVTGALSFAIQLNFISIALAGIIAAWLVASVRKDEIAVRVTETEAPERRRLVEEEVSIHTSQGIWSAARKGIRGKIADGSLDYTEAKEKLALVELDAQTRSMIVAEPDSRQRAFGTIAGIPPAEAGKFGARWGLIFGLPWIVLSVTAGAAKISTDSSTYPLLGTVAAVAPTVLQWPFWGFIAGYFFVLLRGKTGLAKMLLFMTGVFIVSTINTLLLGAGVDWVSIAVSAAQLYSFAFLLGLRSDLETLRSSGGRGFSDLADVHHLGSAFGVVSTIVIATLAAVVATVLASGLQPFVSQLIPPVQTPPAVSQPAPSAAPSTPPG